MATLRVSMQRHPITVRPRYNAPRYNADTAIYNVACDTVSHEGHCIVQPVFVCGSQC